MALPLQEARPCQARRGGPHAGHPPPEASSGLGTLRRLPPSREVSQASALPSACGQQAAGWGGPSRAWGGQKLPCSCTAPRRSPRAPLPSAPRRKMSGGHRVGLALLESVWMLGPPPGAWRWPSRTRAACPQQPRPDSGQPRGFSSWGRVPPHLGNHGIQGAGTRLETGEPRMGPVGGEPKASSLPRTHLQLPQKPARGVPRPQPLNL